MQAHHRCRRHYHGIDAGLRHRSVRAASEPADLRTVGRQATKPWNRSLSAGSRIQVPSPEVSRNELRCDPAALPGSRIPETRETTDGSAELKFRIQFRPADSPSLSVFRVRSRKSPGFQPLCGPFRAAVVGRDAQSPAASGRAALVSLSGHIPVPQCCRRRFARLAAAAANEVGLAISVGLGVRIGSSKAEQGPLILPGERQTRVRQQLVCGQVGWLAPVKNGLGNVRG